MPEPRDVTIRLARIDDAPGLRRTHVAAWLATYRGVMPDDFLDAMDPEQSEPWRALLLTLPDTHAVAVADPGDGTIAGSPASARPRRGANRRAVGDQLPPRLDGPGRRPSTA